MDTQTRINDGDSDQDKGNDGEEGHRVEGRKVKWPSKWVVHAEKLEAEIRHGSEEKELIELLEIGTTHEW